VKTYKSVSTIKLPNFGSVFFRTILIVFQHDYKHKKIHCYSRVQNIHYNISLTDLLKALGSELADCFAATEDGESREN
jgi:hypothetical protein